MPSRGKTVCAEPGCGGYAIPPATRCAKHQSTGRPRDRRVSSSARGYGSQWRKIREGVLALHGIAREQWALYDVDHNPPYNPAVQPDHRMYELIPRLHADHSRKTAKEDGGFGNDKRG